MRVKIHYCRTCGFREQAEAIAEVLNQTLDAKTELREGFWGTFRIECDGEEIFNRWKSRGILGRLGLGRNPLPEEIARLVGDGRIDTACADSRPDGVAS